MKENVIIGNGVAGITAAETIRRLEKQNDQHVVPACRKRRDVL